MSEDLDHQAEAMYQKSQEEGHQRFRKFHNNNLKEERVILKFRILILNLVPLVVRIQIQYQRRRHQ